MLWLMLMRLVAASWIWNVCCGHDDVQAGTVGAEGVGAEGVWGVHGTERESCATPKNGDRGRGQHTSVYELFLRLVGGCWTDA